MTKKETPLSKQYNQIKSKYPDSILLFRLGDFYETFNQDAVITAKVCGETKSYAVVFGQAAGTIPRSELNPHDVLATLIKKIKSTKAFGTDVKVTEVTETE